ncbi:hypothetical protein CJD36_017370 [Flavipsychrobacter stenotrophus]|uniref:Transmembrane protein n=1 Tax=Flavipsychrobacter stenotrophus TaxID=2077091 RepID=A0A2S7SSU7_9BACT|nr:hypothetical protein [Flavipsychrobacter stenotrophus]PQJ09701.1 hypothetical protein CJD36_017370 [Flavipsychrobacter stenotrophus]
MSIRIIVLLLALTIGINTASQAAFVVDKAKTEHNQAPITATNEESVLPADATVTAAPATMASAAPTFGKARISKFAYVMLSIFLLGFVAVGLNDYWRGSSWIVCLVLCLLYVPGLIYALVSMPKYYHNKNKSFRY